MEKDLKETFTEQKSRILGNLRSDCKAILLKRAAFLIHRTKQNYYFNGERPTRLLALRLKHNDAMSSITAIKDSMGILHTAPDEVNALFKNFYEHLYSSEVGLEDQ